MAAKKKPAKKAAAKKKKTAAKKKPAENKLGRTAGEHLRRLHFVEDLLQEHLTDREVCKQVQAQFSLTPEQAAALFDEAIEALKAPTSRASIEVRRARAEHRIMGAAFRFRKDWRAVLKAEELLMKLQGTEHRAADVTLNIDLDTLSEEQLQRIADGEDPAQVVAH